VVELLTRMREIERMLAYQTPFDEVVAAIDACLAMPGSDAYRASIEHYRVSACVAHGRPVDECMAVIDAYTAIQPSLAARAQAVLAACGMRPELAPRYLDALIGELEQAAPADPVAKNALQDAYRLRQRLYGEHARVIAERVLSVDGEPGRIVAVTIYAPEPDRDTGADWRCEFRAQGVLDARDTAHGVDALQALLNAIQGVRKALDDSGLSLTWAGGEPGDHGVPRIVPMFLGRAFARDIEDEIDRRLGAHKPPGAGSSPSPSLSCRLNCSGAVRPGLSRDPAVARPATLEQFLGNAGNKAGNPLAILR
jgi:hypothetical protein